MAPRTKADENDKAVDTQLTADEIQILYQLATQASIRVTEIGKVYSVIQKTEMYLSENFTK